MRHGRLRAIISMLAAVAAFSGMDALLKFFSATYPPMEVAVLRGAAALPFLLVPVLLFGRWQDLKPQRFGMHLARGALAVLVLGTFIYAVRALSLANAYAVFLSAPLIMTALSVPILKERTDRAGWLAISLGLLGVVIMLRPSASGLVSLGSLAALISAIAYAVSGIMVRVLTRTDTTASVVVWTVSLMTVLSLLIAAPHWVALEPRHYRWLILLGGLAAIGSYLLTAAFRAAPAAVVAPLEYTALLWGITIDRLVWHVLPSARVLSGGVVVIASGLYLIWRERAHVAPELGASHGSAEQGRAECRADR
jgi:drug/metabolite transporter (DMT)-like permease